MVCHEILFVCRLCWPAWRPEIADGWVRFGLSRNVIEVKSEGAVARFAVRFG